MPEIGASAEALDPEAEVPGAGVPEFIHPVRCSDERFCPCSDIPLSNLTAEDPEQEIFVRRFEYDIIPTIGRDDWRTQGETGRGRSNISDEDAASRTLDDAIDRWRWHNTGTAAGSTPGGGLVTPRTPWGGGRTYGNQEIWIDHACVGEGAGTVFWYRVAADRFRGPTQFAADSIAIQVGAQEAAAKAICLNSSLPAWKCVGSAVNASIVALTGEPTDWFIMGLPSGLAWEASGNSVNITGTLPSGQTGEFDIEVHAMDKDGNSAIRTFHLRVVEASCGNLPNGRQNQAYNGQLSSAGFDETATWQITAGSLPPGLNLNQNTGAITGTPGSPGMFSFTATISETDGPSCSVQCQIGIAFQSLVYVKMVPVQIQGYPLKFDTDVMFENRAPDIITQNPPLARWNNLAVVPGVVYSGSGTVKSMTIPCVHSLMTAIRGSVSPPFAYGGQWKMCCNVGYGWVSLYSSGDSEWYAGYDFQPDLEMCPNGYVMNFSFVILPIGQSCPQ